MLANAQTSGRASRTIQPVLRALHTGGLIQNDFTPQLGSSTDRSVFSQMPADASCPPRFAQEDCPDHQFVALLDSYRQSGGLARSNEVSALFKHRGGPDVSTLASWIVAREVICLKWQSQPWLPWFQFNPLDLRPLPELGHIIAQHASTYETWEPANWFVQPNSCLAQRTLVETLAFDRPAVLNAARADRCRTPG